MSLKYDILKLSISKQESISRLARKLLVKFPDTHTIILSRKEGVMRPKEFSDFRLTLFINSESESETKRKIEGTTYGIETGTFSVSSSLYHPDMGYKKEEREFWLSDSTALYFHYSVVPQNLRRCYMEFLSIHEKSFIKSGYLNITTIDSSEMKFGDPLFYKLYIVHLYEKGYLIFNKTLKPTISLPGGVMDLAR